MAAADRQWTQRAIAILVLTSAIMALTHSGVELLLPVSTSLHLRGHPSPSQAQAGELAWAVSVLLLVAAGAVLGRAWRSRFGPMRLTIPALLAITGPVVFWLLVRYQFDSNTPFMGLVALERFDVLLAMGALTVFVIASSAPAARSWPSLMARSLLFLWSVAVVLVGLWVVLYAE